MKIDISKIKFDERGLVPAIIQEESGQVLMLAYMNEESLNKTIETGYTHFYSRSRQTLWKKGETSGNVQKVLALYYDCDGDTLLVKVHQTGVACHTGTYSCFSGRRLDENNNLPAVVDQPQEENLGVVLYELYEVIKDRQRHQSKVHTRIIFLARVKIKSLKKSVKRQLKQLSRPKTASKKIFCMKWATSGTIAWYFWHFTELSLKIFSRNL